jgi:soluble lytic murein transglycosylase-like protein
MIAILGFSGSEARSASGATRVSCPTPYDAEIDAAVEDVSTVWTVPCALIKAVIQQESAFEAMALSRSGAVGLMQVLPRNAALLGVAPEELWVPRTNILAGTRLLAILLRHYRGDVVSALVAYNARPRKRFAPVPENGETEGYVRAIMRRWRESERCPGLYTPMGRFVPRHRLYR